MTRSAHPAFHVPALAALALLAGCGGGGGATSSPAPAAIATKLHYVNPAANSGHFQLIVEPASNDSAHLLLDLVGPTGTVAKGVALFLTAGSKAGWGSPAGTDPHAKAGTAFTLGAPALFKSKLSSNDLQVGIFQTGASPATLGSAPILTLALDLGGSVTAGSTLPLAGTAGKTSIFLDAGNVQQSMVLDLGTLTAQ